MESTQALVDPFARGDGNGSRNIEEDWLDAESIFDNEWGSQAATTFRPNDSDGKGHELSKERQEHLERLYARHNGKGNPNRDTMIGKSYVKNDMEMFMSVLEMPEYQRRTVREILQNLDISSNNFGSRRYEKIILTVCSLIADEALSNQRNASVDERLYLTDRFRELMDATEMSSSDHRKLRVSVREKSDYFVK